MNEAINSLLELSPPIALGIFLNGVGFAIKRIKQVNNDFIPIILVLMGMISYPFIAEVRDVSYTVSNPVILNAIFGGCIGGMAVAAHTQVQRFLSNGTKTDIQTKDDTGQG